MSSIDPTQFYVAELRYWDAVYRTLCEIFKVSPEEAKRLIGTYRGQLWEDAEPLERLLAFHAEPLDVAADLADIEQPTDADARAYDALMRRRRRAEQAPKGETSQTA